MGRAAQRKKERRERLKRGMSEKRENEIRASRLVQKGSALAKHNAETYKRILRHPRCTASMRSHIKKILTVSL